MKTNFIKAGLLTIVIATGVTLTSCEKEVKTPKIPGIDLAKMDKNTSPKDDFFKHVNGGWLEKAEIHQIELDGEVSMS